MLDANGAEAFTSSALLTAEPTTRKLYAIYFDTPDQALLKAGLSLRIRRSGSKRIQTIKGRDPKGAGLLDRSEWEQPVADDHPMLDAATPIAALLGDAVTDLAPAFVVKVERRTWLMETEDTAIELVLDRGTVIAGDRRSSLCEIELELKRGKPQALFALGRSIAETHPARLGVMTKAERGYRLLGPAHSAFKADKIRFDTATSSAQACQAIMGLCLRHYRLNEEQLLVGRDPEALHQARVALRRLRSALAIFKPMLIGEALAHLQSELRWLAGTLGEARDLDVLLDQAEPGALRDRLQLACDKAHADVRAVLESGRCRMLLFDLTEWMMLGAWSIVPDRQALRKRPARDFARQALRKLRKRVKKRGADLEQLSDEKRHDLRKAAKRLRYGVEFFGGLFPKSKPLRRYRKFSDSLEDLQDNLGDLNDLATRPQVLERLHLLGQSGAEDLLAHHKKSRILAEAEDAFAGLMDRKVFWS
ncbi:CYTH and CHAD domain-containing protein [Novosphingobium terrae]|uniref:CYTH and CHAD domain-containing protein n=1 Tax=Novosphingobium terrae TaxID=2726189 RepID=UPI00197F4C8A|nr:CHAD domain-containing protein [Novosphingobium terrae]